VRVICWMWCGTFCHRPATWHGTGCERQWLDPAGGQCDSSTGGYPDLADVKGQLGARRALEIAAAGGHSLLLIGPPGAGKSMLAQRFAGLLPPMTTDEALQSAAMASLGGRFSLDHWAAPHLPPAPHGQCGGFGGRWLAATTR
jgi:predicted ATPase with chaperone activity